MINSLYQGVKFISTTRAHTRKGVRSLNEKPGSELKQRNRQYFNNEKDYALSLKRDQGLIAKETYKVYIFAESKYIVCFKQKPVPEFIASHDNGN